MGKKKKICIDNLPHDWQPIKGEFSIYKPSSGFLHIPVKCSKCGAKRTKIVDVLKKRKERIEAKRRMKDEDEAKINVGYGVSREYWIEKRGFSEE